MQFVSLCVVYGCRKRGSKGARLALEQTLRKDVGDDQGYPVRRWAVGSFGPTGTWWGEAVRVLCCQAFTGYALPNH